MIRKGILFFLTAVVLSCCHGNRALVQENTASDIVEASPLDSIFVSPRLQDSLKAFVAAVDSFPVGYGPQVGYTVLIHKYENRYKHRIDTMILFQAYNTLITPRLHTHLKGAVQDGMKIVGVVYCGFQDLPDIVNEASLDKDLYMRNTDFYIHHVRQNCDIPDLCINNSRLYKLCGKDSLQLITLYKSRFEDPALPYLFMNTYDRTKEILGGEPINLWL